jgi:hypothetical protein
MHPSGTSQDQGASSVGNISYKVHAEVQLFLFNEVHPTGLQVLIIYCGKSAYCLYSLMFYLLAAFTWREPLNYK